MRESVVETNFLKLKSHLKVILEALLTELSDKKI